MTGDNVNCWSFELQVDKCKDHAMLFLTTCPRAISGFKMGGGQIGPPEAVYMEVGSSYHQDYPSSQIELS